MAEVTTSSLTEKQSQKVANSSLGRFSELGNILEDKAGQIVLHLSLELLHRLNRFRLLDKRVYQDGEECTLLVEWSLRMHNQRQNCSQDYFWQEFFDLFSDIHVEQVRGCHLMRVLKSLNQGKRDVHGQDGLILVANARD